MTGFLTDPTGPGLPYFSPITIPNLPSLSLSEDERRMISLLQARAWRQRTWMMLTDSYYRGEQLIADLGIAIPPELAGLRTLVGWPRIAIDPIVYRLRFDGFRLPGATEVDSDIADLMLANRMNSEQSLAYKDAMVKGRGWLIVGSPPDGEEFPQIAVESPLNVSAMWDVRSLKPKMLLQSYWVDSQRHAALHIPGQSIYMGQDDVTQEWQITNRDKHGFPFVPAVRMANEPESDRRDGVSEITAEIMSITDAACRTLLGLEVAREFYSVPQKYILGASESDFKNPDGTAKTSWSTYIARVLAIEPDEEGNLPTLGQFQAYDPSVFTKIVEMYASQMAGILGAPPQDLGLYTQGNPISAEAQQVSESRRDRYARHKQDSFSAPLIDTVQMALRFRNGGNLPDKYRRLEVDWMPPELLNVAQMTDALTKQSAEGMVSPVSDVVLKRLGYTAIERAQLEQDRLADQGEQFLAEVAHSLTAKNARVDKSLTADVVAQPAAAIPGPDAVKPNVKPAAGA